MFLLKSSFFQRIFNKFFNLINLKLCYSLNNPFNKLTTKIYILGILQSLIALSKRQNVILRIGLISIYLRDPKFKV